jgi:stress-induced-phosphoprotein 1
MVILIGIVVPKKPFLCRAAVYFEMGEYEKCAADCDTAVEKGREARADYKIIARALTRKGNALMRQDRIEEAIQTYQKSLTEHRRARE